MKKILLFNFLFFFGYQLVSSQNISGKVIDLISSDAIENVAIQTDNKTGTISDKFGKFTLEINKAKFLTFSCLGYESKTISAKELENLNFVIALTEASNQLDEIYLNLAKISLDSLLIKATKSMKENYISGTLKQKFYAIESSKIHFKNVDLDLKSSTLLSKKNKELAKKELAVFSKKVIESNPNFSTEFMGILTSKNFYSQKVHKSYLIKKTDSLIGIRQLKSTEDFTINNVQDKLQALVLNYLNKKHSYKVKSGWFKVDDSVSFNQHKNDFNLKNSYTHFKPLRYTDEAIKKAQFFKNDDENNFLSTKYYNHTKENNILLGTSKNYVVSFSPRKSKTKYIGKIYINSTDFSITKIEYQYAKGKQGEHFNLKLLLGIKFSENKKTGILYYKKNKHNKHHLVYFKEDVGNYTYANRPFKFIENSSEKNKIKFNVKIELAMDKTTEVLFNDVLEIKESEFKPLKKEDVNKRIDYISENELKNYPWKNRKVIIDSLKDWE